MGNCCGPRRSYSGIADQTSELTTALITEDYYADSAHSSQPSSAATAAAAGIPIDSAVRMNAEVVDFSTAEMERATSKFSGRNKVDEGSFGEVYRGKLADGRIAAIKVLRLARVNRLLQRYEEEFASLMTTFKLGKLVAVILVIGHWLSCLFFGLGSRLSCLGRRAFRRRRLIKHALHHGREGWR